MWEKQSSVVKREAGQTACMKFGWLKILIIYVFLKQSAIKRGWQQIRTTKLYWSKMQQQTLFFTIS
jgi:hypothetical protein